MTPSRPGPELPGAQHSSQPSQNGAHSNALAPRLDARSDTRDSLREVNWNDPHTRAVLDQLVSALHGDNSGHAAQTRPASQRYGAILRRRWKPLLLVFALTSALLGYKMRPQQDIYSAIASMTLPSANSGSANNDAADALAGIRGIDVPSRTDTQIAIITSPGMVKRALSALPASLRTRGWAARAENGAAVPAPPPNIKAVWTAWWNPSWGYPVVDKPVLASAFTSPDIIDIAVNSHDPDASIALANGMISTYAAYLRENSTSSTQQRLEFVRGTLGKKARDLDEAKRALRAYQERTNISDIGQQQTQIVLRIAALRDAVTNAQQELQAGATGERVQNDTQYTNLQSAYQKARSDYDEITRTFRPSAPEAQLAKRRLDEAQATVNTRLNALLNAARARAAGAQEAYNQAVAQRDQLPRIALDLDRLNSRIATLSADVGTLQTQYTRLDIENSARIQNVTPLTPAVAAFTSAQTWSRVAVLALLSGLMLAAICAALLEALDHSLHGADDVEALPGATLLGALPLLRGKNPRNLGRLGDAAHAAVSAPDLLELCRIIRSNLTFASPDAPLRSILVTSPDLADGKSLCACNLAAVMAFDGRRVLLLDGDLRRPTQHKLAGVELGLGLSDVLNGATLDDALRPTPAPGLSLLTAGALRPNPTELLNSQNAHELFALLRERFDCVVVDSPPALALADAQLWASLCDATVLVASANRTPRARVQRAQSLLRHAGGRVLGIVLNRVRSRADLGMGGYGADYAESVSALKKLPAPVR